VPVEYLKITMIQPAPGSFVIISTIDSHPFFCYTRGIVV
jgi:hypothetical protein